MRILYIMHIPWGWIKQRPHFLAEEMQTDFEVDVRYKKPWKVRKGNLLNHSLQGKEPKSFILLPIYKIPVIKYLPYIYWINIILAYLQIGRLKKYDYIWVTSISMYECLKPWVRKKKVVYDCMDDELEFPDIMNNALLRQHLQKNEKDLMAKADLVFCSSCYLKNKILTRTGVNREIVVLNNAVELPQHEIAVPLNILEIEKKYFGKQTVFMYVGTISEWFDFDLVLRMLQQIPTALVLLIGPGDVSIPEHERLVSVGPVDRKYLFYLMDKSAVLFMPFKINELIRSVNPVKLYEYIYVNKPVIVPDYEEIEQFKPYVYTYPNEEEFELLCLQASENNLFPRAELSDNVNFARNNTWKKRYEMIRAKLLGKKENLSK